MLGLAGAFAIASALGPSGLSSLAALRAEVAGAEAREQKLSEEKRLLILRVEALHDNLKVIESVARDNLGLIRPGEKVIRFEESR